MNKKDVIAIFDVGKTNKKLFLFDKEYQIVFERSTVLDEANDEDGFPCEDLEKLSSFIRDSFHDLLRLPEFDVRAVNFSAYGASFVFVGEHGRPLAPLYNYLKPYPGNLLKQFYDNYGGEEDFTARTASPVLGNLNSGMQLYRIKYERPQLFQKIKHAFHLPQFLSHLISGMRYSDITSIGCHTNLWDFQKNKYHDWVSNEGVMEKLLPIERSDKVTSASHENWNYEAGIGLHDSSAALIPYLQSFQEAFVLISTGTWCISLNPFNNSPLSPEELKNDCLCYLQYNGKPVKAARLFAGYIHEEQTKRIAEYFLKDLAKYKQLRFNDDLAHRVIRNNEQVALEKCPFEKRDLSAFASDDEAYHQLLADLVAQQLLSTNFILQPGHVKKIFVDGGFSKNDIYMHLLASAFPTMEVCATSMSQATAIGAAVVIHDVWNQNSLPRDLISLKPYFPMRKPVS